MIGEMKIDQQSGYKHVRQLIEDRYRGDAHSWAVSAPNSPPAEAGHVMEGMQPLSVPSVYKSRWSPLCTLLALEQEKRERLD
jgi:hypothetical protein